MNTPVTEKIHFVSIYKHGIPIIYRAIKPTFGNLDWLFAHHFNGLNPSAFSKWNLQNIESFVLKRHLKIYCDERINPNNPFEEG
jgi:hypothetical protein